MKPAKFIEKYFWVFLFIGLVTGLVIPADNGLLMALIKPALMLMLFTVFLKADIIQVFQRMKNYPYVLYLVLMYMAVIPVSFFLIINPFNQQLAIGVLLLVSMPAGVSSPVVADILKGNTELAVSIAITTSLIAPFSVPFLFWVLKIESISINPWGMLMDLSMIIFIPLMVSQFIKKYLDKGINGKSHLFSSINVILLSLLVFAVMGANREILLSNSILSISVKLGYAYIVFILLHIIGYLMGFKENRKGRISTAVGAAYVNNGMAIVLAAIYFSPYVLVFIVLSEIPWNTLIWPFRKIIVRTQSKNTLNIS
jgi:predicted Na+-dependent transporter